MIIKLHSLKIRAGFSNLVKILPHNYLVVKIGSFLYSYKNGALLTEVSKLKLKSFKLLKLDYDPGHSKSLKSFLKTVCSMSLSARIGSLATVCNMSLLITPFIRLSELHPEPMRSQDSVRISVEMISTSMPGLGHWRWTKSWDKEQKDNIFQIMQFTKYIWHKSFYFGWLPSGSMTGTPTPFWPLPP